MEVGVIVFRAKKVKHIQRVAIQAEHQFAHENALKLHFKCSNTNFGVSRFSGMNSRLNLAIREKYGYTYNIESGYQPYKS